MGSGLNRRGFLSTAGANTEEGLKAAPPAHVPDGNAVRPGIAPVQGGPDAATDPACLSYPASPPAGVPGVPGGGGSYTAVTPLWGTNPPAGNSFFQAVNKALGVELTVKPADGNTYDTIVPTMTAAKKLPDWINLPDWWNAKFNTGSLVGSRLADLTPYLSGDNIRKYPNLAALPTGAWQNGVWGDRLYGVPCFSTSFGIPGATVTYRITKSGNAVTGTAS